MRRSPKFKHRGISEVFFDPRHFNCNPEKLLHLKREPFLTPGLLSRSDARGAVVPVQ
jgi:hypothetical protein